ncbi:FAD-dependent oxidoreductase [Maricurvus nonylphenolicus]|uniref:NAD(P)/FAD-dependent oxidoreductase n=1 Tax=Maricurvus nonylphenolicus TaxID=1008307 RepID=UPI0036F32A81
MTSFETITGKHAPRVAIIGSGISGLACAYELHERAQVTVYEANDYIGGHTATKDVDIDGRHYAIDTGFIVFNDWTYPNFIRLMDKIGVASKATEMSFSVSCDMTGLEYGGADLNSLFAQRRNLFNPRHWGMLRDILRFNRQVLTELQAGDIESTQLLGDYLQEHGYGQAFINKYLIPMGSAIWSASTTTMLNFPLLFFARFFANHGLLSVNHRPQWRVIEGGSRAYIEPLTKSFKDRIKCSTPVTRVIRTDSGVIVESSAGQDVYDDVVFACHSDQALNTLVDPTLDEREVLGNIPYQNNQVILHTDERLLPSRKLAWSSWNYRIKRQQQDRAVLTYNMNILQGIEAPETFCVTLNDTENIDPEKILGSYEYSHPVFTPESVKAAESWDDINGSKRTWFCGAYWANGFHEDGCRSGLRVAQALLARHGLSQPQEELV